MAASVLAIADAQQALADDSSLATEAARDHFPDHELSLIEDVIERDVEFYDPSISERTVKTLNDFARKLDILDAEDVPYESVVATQFRSEWE